MCLRGDAGSSQRVGGARARAISYRAIHDARGRSRQGRGASARGAAMPARRRAAHC